MILSITTFASQLVLILYGIYVWIAFISLAIPIFIILVLTPTKLSRRKVARWSAKLFFLLIGSPVRLEGEKLLPTSSSIIVANHASYLDGIILTASLPPNFTFLIKQEMAAFPFAGFLLKRIGSEFVDRKKSSQRSKVARRLFKAAEQGNSLAFFPEGTFVHQPGLRPFHMGAFRASCHTKLPIVPIVISGSRDKLPADSWLCTPGTISVKICKTIDPRLHNSAQELLEQARISMLDCLSEADLRINNRKRTLNKP
jgi:1-acyl-sn-glycerol-3-phosphate acyltransferase